ncbi:MAG: hypothetical protein JW910_10910 [Anaerolineae bacterium]|nr:hypothetical protein [Anaerolineae bacterium]
MSERSTTYIARRRPIEMLAEPVATQCVVDTWEGPRTAYPGDFIMTGVKGEHWPVPGAGFDELYEVLGPVEDGPQLRVRKRVMELRTFQTYEPLRFRVHGEDFHAETGYFIVAYEDGSCYPCEPNVFFETFQIVRQAGEELDISRYVAAAQDPAPTEAPAR